MLIHNITSLIAFILDVKDFVDSVSGILYKFIIKTMLRLNSKPEQIVILSGFIMRGFRLILKVQDIMQWCINWPKFGS